MFKAMSFMSMTFYWMLLFTTWAGSVGKSALPEGCITSPEDCVM